MAAGVESVGETLPSQRLDQRDRQLLRDILEETGYSDSPRDGRPGGAAPAWADRPATFQNAVLENNEAVPPLELVDENRDWHGARLIPAFTIMEHKSITHDSLTPLGFKSAGLFAAELGDLSQDLDKSTRKDPSHHFDNDYLKESLAVVDNHRNSIIEKLSHGPLSAKEKFAVLYEFGQLSHTVQDFYAHSDYVELKLKKNPGLDAKHMPLMDWRLLATNGMNAPDRKLKTGYYYYKNELQNELTQFYLSRSGIISRLEQQGERAPGTQYLSSDDYAKLQSFDDRINYATSPKYSVLNEDLEKDDEDSEEGKVVDPKTGLSLYDYARDLAVRETQRQWQLIEQSVRERVGSQAERIMQEPKEMPYSGPVLMNALTVDGIITESV